MLIYKFRFLDRIQIQTLMNHKDARRINVWLKDLVEKKFLGRIYTRKIPENIKPAIYYVAINGIHWFEGRRECNSEILARLKKEPYRSERFRNHCLFLAQIYIDLLKSSNLEFTLKTFETKVDIVNYEEILTPFPDAYITLIKQKGSTKKTNRYFLEATGEGTPRYYLRHRIREYLDYFENHSTSTKVLLVCPNELTLKFLERFIPQTKEHGYYYDNRASFSLALNTDVIEKSLIGEIWRTISV